MKNLLLLFILTISTFSFPQGSLQFNRILYVDNNVQTVPNGKVWKISFIPEKIGVTYIKQTATSGGTTGCTGTVLRTLNTVTEAFDFSLGAFVINGNVNIPPSPNGVFWLSPGTTIYCPIYQTPLQPSVSANYRYSLDGNTNFCGPYTAPQVNYNAVLSVIEFNVIP